MGLKVEIEVVNFIGKGIWSGEINQRELGLFGKPHFSKGQESVIGIYGSVKLTSENSITFDPSLVEVLNLGQSNKVIILEIQPPSKNMGVSLEPIKQEPKKARSLYGDRAFLTQCRLLLNNDAYSVAESLLREIRGKHGGQLQEGLARKWVNEPENFVALTIQNRDQSLAVHVKGRVQDYDEDTIDIKKDRGPYLRFKVWKKEQIPATMRLVDGSVG